MDSLISCRANWGKISKKTSVQNLNPNFFLKKNAISRVITLKPSRANWGKISEKMSSKKIDFTHKHRRHGLAYLFPYGPSFGECLVLIKWVWNWSESYIYGTKYNWWKRLFFLVRYIDRIVIAIVHCRKK